MPWDDEVHPWFLEDDPDGGDDPAKIDASLAVAVREMVDPTQTDITFFDLSPHIVLHYPWQDKRASVRVASCEAIVAATTTPHFPVLRDQHLAEVQRGIDAWQSPTGTHP